MISFSFKSRDKRPTKPVARARPQPSLEQQLFGKPAVTAAPGERPEIGVQDWVRSSRDLRDGCEVQDVALDTLPADLMASFNR